MMNRKLFRPRAKTQTGVKAKPFNKRGSLTPNIPRSDSRSDFELTSIFIRQQIDKKNYNEIVDTLRKLPRDYILKCLESFPFKALNRSVPHSFPIWETLLVKLHSSEEGYVAQLPCAACDELVIRIADILAYLNRHSDQSNDLYLQCKRVLKRVYIQYPDILGNLMKEYERLSRALYSLTLHIPLGTDASAKSLQEAICDDIHMTIKNLKSSLEDLEELTRENIGHVKQNGLNSRQVYNQRDIQERLYYNHCIARCALPSKIKSNLAQLLEMLDSRIQGDKDILALFASLRQRHETLTDAEPVEPCLRSYQASIECAISILQEIQNELAITSPSGSPDKKEDEMQSHFESYTSLPLSTSSLDQSQFPTLEPQSVTELQSMSRDKSSSENHIRIVRPLSAGVVVPRSLKGPYSEGISSSDQDLSLTANQPSLIQANRMGSAKRRGGFFRRSFRNSIRRLSSSTGNMSSKTKLNGNGASHVNENEEALKGELLEARETIQALRKRERELTDRLSEQAQRHLQESDRFEDILMGANRPTLVVQRYQEIYSQERVEAYDALTDIEGLSEEVFIPSLLLDILKFAYSAAQCYLESLHNGWKRALNIKDSSLTEPQGGNAIKQLQSAVSIYIRKSSSSFNHKDIMEMVLWDLKQCYGRLSYYTAIEDCQILQAYVESCCQLTWDLVIQNPPMVLKHNEIEFSPELHTRFHSANSDSIAIICYQWPTLIYQTSGAVLIKGIVIT